MENTELKPMNYCRIARKAPKIFKNRAGINISYYTSNKLKYFLGTPKDQMKDEEKSGIYQINCESCDKIYIGQTRRNLKTRFKEHKANFKNNHPEKSAIVKHSLEEGNGEKNLCNTTKVKVECDYGEKCYRKNPAHFKDYEHKHLTELLKIVDRTDQALPEHVKPIVSKETIREQLDILRSLGHSNGTNSGEELNNTRKRPSPSSSDTNSDGRKVLPKKSRNIEFQNKKLSGTQEVETNRNGPKEMSSTTSTLSSKEHSKKMQSAQNMSEALSYMQEVKKRSQGDICKKHKAAAPYYFFLTSVTDSRKTHTEALSLQFFDILDPLLGDLESSLQINFMVEFGWLMAQYHVANQRGKPITLIYGEMDVANLKVNGITAVQVRPPSPFGSHHTKMCVLAYKDGSVRVCVHTANLVESDWDNRVQGVWLSPLCPALPLDANATAGESPTHFKQDLIQYLSAYRLPELQPWIGKLRRADFTHINVFFVASTPGSHKGADSEKWGHVKLGKLLSRHVQIPPSASQPPPTWQVITQCSSIGSLGPQPTAWFCGQVKQSMSGALGQTLQSQPPIRLVYPTFSNVAGSYDSLLGGGGLPYSSRTHEKQPWLHQYLYQWKCEVRHRTQAMPHIKTYSRVSPDLSQLAWFHLTSANLSKAAWGSLTKAGALSILNYEAGVLYLPKFVVGSNTLPIKQKTASDVGVPVFPMPFDLPLVQYSSQDVPWFCDNLA